MLTLADIQKKMESLTDWSLEGNSLVKDFQFPDFKGSLYFVNKVGELAQENNHHPDILISYNLVRLTLTTHSEHTLTEKDFDLALKIDQIK